MTLEDIADACEHVTGIRPDFDHTRPITHDAWEAEQRTAERGQSVAEGRMIALPHEMDGAAADYVYGRQPASDWRRP